MCHTLIIEDEWFIADLIAEWAEMVGARSVAFAMTEAVAEARDHGPDARSRARCGSPVEAALGLPGLRSIADVVWMRGPRTARALVGPYHCATACVPRRTGHQQVVRRHDHEGVHIARSAP